MKRVLQESIRSLSYDEKNSFCLALERGRIPPGWTREDVKEAIGELEFLISNEWSRRRSRL